jgi:hypothetical protein
MRREGEEGRRKEGRREREEGRVWKGGGRDEGMREEERMD